MSKRAKLKKGDFILKRIPKPEQTQKLCETAINSNPLEIKFASRKLLTFSICWDALRRDVAVFGYIPSKFITAEMCDFVIEKKPSALSKIPLIYQTESLCLKAIQKDLSVSYYLSAEMKQSINIVNYQKSKGAVKFIKKYYDKKEPSPFKLEIEVNFAAAEQYPFSYRTTLAFDNFDSFYRLLDGNLDRINLLDCDFHGINLKKYNISGAAIRSDVLQEQGLYDSRYWESFKANFAKLSSFNEEKEKQLPLRKLSYSLVSKDEEESASANEQAVIFYISDIHLDWFIFRRFKEENAATKEEVYEYVRSLAREMIDSVEGMQNYTLFKYLLIAGDTSDDFGVSEAFYEEVVRLWRYWVVVILGNHELRDPYVELEDNISAYRALFKRLHIYFLQNDLICFSLSEILLLDEQTILKLDEKDIKEASRRFPIIILGGIGFDALNKEFVADWGKSFNEVSPEEAYLRRVKEGNRFNTLYKKVMNALRDKQVIVLTHNRKAEWNSEPYNPRWIYVNGHNHRNYFCVNDKKTVYADNQIGYRAGNLGLKHFYCDNTCDLFFDYKDGVYPISREKYLDFNQGKNIISTFNRRGGQIYMLKKDDLYMFIIYYSFTNDENKKFLYLLSGGVLRKLKRNKKEDLSYYYDKLSLYGANIKTLMAKYTAKQNAVSRFIKHIGGAGKIHGCIIDVDPQEERGFSYCHLYLNPNDGKLTPYFALDIRSRIVYKDFKTMLLKSEFCNSLIDGYLELEKTDGNVFAVAKYQNNLVKLNKDFIEEDRTEIYKMSRIVRTLQYCSEKNVVRSWNEAILDVKLVDRIKNAKKIEEMIDDRLIIADDNDM